jgi:hypothetical protein
MRRGDVIMSGYVAVVCAAMGLIVWLVLAPRGGDFASAPYHFDVRYPAGWQVSDNNGTVPGGWPTLSAAKGVPTGNSQASPIPLQVTLTRVDESAVPGPTSSLTITVWDLSNPTGVAQAASLASNKALHPTTVAGLAGLAASPAELPVPGKSGTNTTTVDTHTDYYVVHGSYEYQLTTDAISGENADGALASMLASFHLTA